MPRQQCNSSLDYIRKLYAPQDALLERIDAALAECNSSIQIGPEEGKLLQLLIRMHGVNTILEIGTLAGTSAIWMARALPEGGHLHTITKDTAHAALARRFFAESEVAAHITLHEGDAQDILPRLNERGPFDMVFIDADKINYPHYLNWAEAYIRQGGLIVADNTLLFGSVAQDTPPPDIAPTTWHAMREFNARLADPERYLSLLLPTEQGMTVAIKLF